MEQLLKELLESYEIYQKNHNYSSFCINKGKGTKKYMLDRISVLRSQLLEMQNKLKNNR